MAEAGSTSLTLIERAARGVPEARDAFARVYEPVVRAYLTSRWKDARRDSLDDAVQEVFVDCFREEGALVRLDSGRPQRFRAYLFGVTRNVALRFESRGGRNRTVSPGDSGWESLQPDEGESPSQAFDRAWAQTILRSALARWIEAARLKGPRSERRVELLELRFVQDHPIREIARRWRLHPAWVHKEYARARTEFKGVLKATLADHSPTGRNVPDEELGELLDLL